MTQPPSPAALLESDDKRLLATSRSERLRIEAVVAGSRHLVCSGLVALLAHEPDIDVVAEGEHGDELLDGIAEQLRRATPGSRVVMVTEQSQPGRHRRPCIVTRMANDPFRAVAHPIRRGIVERLAQGPATVGVVTHGFGVSKPTISKHLKVLEGAGVVVRTVGGRTHQLSLVVAPLAEAADWFDRQRETWTRMFDAVDDLLTEGKVHT